ncbi:MAG: RNA polymerase sigma-70 factor [Planctomycetota bacterium]|nr:RNA polymerase sigma-70 factor [Planctomycetota bacterium]
MKEGESGIVSLSDEELMLRVKGDSPCAFEELVRRYQKRVINIAYRFTSEESASEDVAQEVFCRLWEHRRSYVPSARFSTFLYRVTANFCISEYRSQRRRQEVHIERKEEEADFEFPSEESSPQSGVERGELEEKVKSAVAALPESQRMAVILSRYEGLSYVEIAEVMGTTVEAVKSLLVRARVSLKERLSRFLKEK